MIRNIKITNYKNDTMTINLASSYSSGFTIRKIDGLGPVKANIITTKNVISDGDIYNSARADKRNIVLTLGFDIRTNLDLNMIEDARHKSYKFFPLKSLVKINIETDRREVYTYGYVESNEPDIFSQDETTMVSIICPNSYFSSENERNVVLDQLRPKFKFPFEVLREELPDINLLEPDTEYTVQLIKEDEELIGNIQYNLVNIDNVYGDLEKYIYGDIVQTYGDIKNIT